MAPSDRNLVDFYAEGGVTFTGMMAHRSDDSLAVGFAYAGISDQVHGFDVDSGLPVVRNYEALFEICYTTQIQTGWTLQSDFQYIVQPGWKRTERKRHGRDWQCIRLWSAHHSEFLTASGGSRS